MRKLIHNITPAFILDYNQHLLTHSPLGWQLQLPIIGWLWFLITLLTLPVPFLFELSLRGDNDVESVMLLGVMVSVLQFFLYVYILIQFNSTKSFGARTWWQGIAEQLGYIFVMLLCLSQLMIFPLIIEYRKSQVMTEEEIFKDAKAFNHGRHYFMDVYSNHMYFPNDSFFVAYMNYQPEPNSTKYQAEFYNQDIKPLMEGYINEDSLGIITAPKVTRDSKGPKLYYTGNNFIDDEYSYLKGIGQTSKTSNEEIIVTRYYRPENNIEKSMYQLEKRTDAQRLEEIKAFIAVYYKYKYMTIEGSEGIGMRLDAPETVLKKYKANQIQYTQHYQPEYYDNEGNISYPTIENYAVDGVQSTIMEAKYRKMENFLMLLMICFHVAFAFGLLLFLFKNNRLRDFILMFVYTGILTLVVTIISVLIREEGLAIHTPIIIFAAGIIILILFPSFQKFSSIRSIVLMLSNLTISHAWLFFYFYFDQYLRVIDHYDSDFCMLNPTVCDEQQRMFSIILWTCVWGGPALYLFGLSALYKRTYERQWALPMGK